MDSLWFFLILLAIGVFITAYLFLALSKEEQKQKVYQWLIRAVLLAEREYGGKTGKLKLRDVYAQFVATWPKVANWMSFNTFSDLVDLALVEMHNMIEDNPAIQAFVEGGKTV